MTIVGGSFPVGVSRRPFVVLASQPSRPVTNCSRQGGCAWSLTENGPAAGLPMLVCKRWVGLQPGASVCVCLGTFGLFCPAVSAWKFPVQGIAMECKIISPYPKVLHGMRPT